MPPAYVKPYVKRQKNDSADAEAICEAVTRANMRFVATKTPAQQSCLMLHRTRHLFIRQQTAVINAIRAHLADPASSQPSDAKALNNYDLGHYDKAGGDGGGLQHPHPPAGNREMSQMKHTVAWHVARICSNCDQALPEFSTPATRLLKQRPTCHTAGSLKPMLKSKQVAVQAAHGADAHENCRRQALFKCEAYASLLPPHWMTLTLSSPG